MLMRHISTLLGTLAFICAVLAVYSFANPPVRPQVISGAASCPVCTDVIVENVKDTSMAGKYALAAIVTGLPFAATRVYLRLRRKAGKNHSKSHIIIVEFFGLGTVLIYLLLTLPLAFSSNWRISTKTEAIIEPRIIPLLVIGIALASYSWYVRRQPSRLVIATLLILIITSVVWHFGVRVYS